jgi:hypothetical protein
LLLYGQIPHKAGVTTMLVQHFQLLRVGKQTEPTHTDNIIGATDNLTRGGSSVSPPTKSRDFARRTSDD